MRKILLLLVLALIIFAIVCRNRLYVRDPIGVLSRGGTKEAGAQVYVNFSSDVLVENDDLPKYIEVVQHGQHAGVPQQTMCIHFVVCLLDDDVATLRSSGQVHTEVMNGRLVQFRDAKGEADVSLR